MLNPQPVPKITRLNWWPALLNAAVCMGIAAYKGSKLARMDTTDRAWTRHWTRARHLLA